MATIPESHRDLLDAEFATLGTVDTHGHPQLTELWFLAEQDEVRVSLSTARQKTRNLQRNPAFSLLILDVTNPHRYVELRGTARIEPDPDKVGAKYGLDLRQMDQPGDSRVVVTLPAEHVHAWG